MDNINLNPLDDKSAMWEQTLVHNVHQLTQRNLGNTSMRNNFDRIMHGLYKPMRDYETELSKDVTALQGDKPVVDKQGIPLNISTPTPVALSNSGDLIAYLSAIYAIRNPILQVPDLPNAMHITTAVKEAINRDSMRGNWALELIKIIQNAVHLNYAPAVVRSAANGFNTIKALCPYNTFVDDSVQLDEVPRKASYAGYMTKVTLASLYALLAEIPKKEHLATWGKAILKDPLQVAAVSALGVGYGDGICGYYEPQFRVTTEGRVEANSDGFGGSQPDWAIFGREGLNQEERVQKNLAITNSTMYVTVVYRRVQPEWLGLPKRVYGYAAESTSNSAAGLQTPVYKLTYLNNAVLLAVEPVAESHGLLPVIVGTLGVTTTSGDLPYSIVEQIIPSQSYEAKLKAARITALRRAMKPRSIHDPTAIKNPEALNDESGDASIPIEPHKAEDGSADIRTAYMNIPFDASGTSALLGMLGEGESLAERIIGNNAQMRGGRTPGNKLQSEVMRETSMSEGRFQVYAIIFQQTFMSPMKQIIRSNLGEVQGVLTYYDRDTDTEKAVDPQEFAASQFDFEISDGLLPSQKRIAPEAISQLLTAVVQIPQLQQEFDLRDLFILFGRSVGVDDIDKIKKPQQNQPVPTDNTQSSPDQEGAAQ